MLRTRLFWFSVGFAATAASISQLVWRDLLAYRCALSSDMERNFDALEARISNLESVRNRNSIPSAEEGSNLMRCLVGEILYQQLCRMIPHVKDNGRYFDCVGVHDGSEFNFATHKGVVPVGRVGSDVCNLPSVQHIARTRLCIIGIYVK